MFSLAKILIPIDFSERCLGATCYAVPLAEHFHSEINLLHVLPPFEGSGDVGVDGVTVGEIMAARQAKAQKQLDDFLNAALHHLRISEPCSTEILPRESLSGGWASAPISS